MEDLDKILTLIKSADPVNWKLVCEITRNYNFSFNDKYIISKEMEVVMKNVTDLYMWRRLMYIQTNFILNIL